MSYIHEAALKEDLKKAKAYKKKKEQLDREKKQKEDEDAKEKERASRQTTKKVSPKPSKLPQIFFDINIDGKGIGKFVVELRTDLVPKTCENFRILSTGEKGPGIRYKHCSFHRIVTGFMAQTGDFLKGDGTGTYSIYGGSFADENFDLSHNSAGIVSMANNGPNTNGCQFFITLDKCSELDGKHVAFGEVIKGMEVIQKIGECGSADGTPTKEVVINACGQLRTF